MAEKWVETTVEGFEAWAAARGGADLHGARILVELADLNRTAELDGELLREILLEDFPENVVAGPEDAPAVLDAARDLVGYLAEGGELDENRVGELREVLDTVGPEFAAALEAGSEDDGNAAELFRRMMAADGVDLDDEASIEAWVREFDALSDEEKVERTMRQFAADNVVPPVRLAPREELAAAARESALFVKALKLADWADGRPLGEDGPTGEDARAAAEALGIAPDVEGGFPALGRLWEAVEHADLVEVTDGGARRADGPGLADDEAVLALWVALFDGVVTREFEEGAALSPLEVCQSELPSVLLHLYEHGAATPRGELVTGLIEHVQDTYEVADAETLALGLPEALRMELDDLARWGVLTIGGDAEVSLTPLGVYAVRELLLADGYTAPLIGDLADRPAVELVGGLVHHREDTAEQEIALWLAARSAEEAAGDLLELMRSGQPSQRNIAAVVLQQVDRSAEPLIRDALDAPQTRPYAAIWLNTHGDEKTTPSESDLQWMFVDTVAGMIEAVGPHDAVQLALSESEVDADLTALVEDVWRLDHPEVGEVLKAIGDHHHDREFAKLARKSAFKSRSK